LIALLKALVLNLLDFLMVGFDSIACI